MNDLNTLMQSYAQGGLKKKDFEGLIFQYILDNTHRFRLFNWEKDECADYLCWLYPRLSKAIDRYEDKGSSFETYIGSLIYWSVREYHSCEEKHHITEYACWKAMSEEDASVRDEEPPYLDAADQKAFKIENGKNIKPQEILILLLKSYAFVSEGFLERIAAAVGVHPQKLDGMINKLKEMRGKHDEALRRLKLQIHSQYYRCIGFEERLAAASKGSALYEKLKARLDRARVRLANMKTRLARVRPDASNRQVAEILGIPKGTVDSNLHLIKNRFAAEL